MGPREPAFTVRRVTRVVPSCKYDVSLLVSDVMSLLLSGLLTFSLFLSFLKFQFA